MSASKALNLVLLDKTYERNSEFSTLLDTFQRTHETTAYELATVLSILRILPPRPYHWRDVALKVDLQRFEPEKMLSEFGHSHENCESHHKKLARVAVFQVLCSLERIDTSERQEGSEEDELKAWLGVESDLNTSVVCKNGFLWRRESKNHTFHFVKNKKIMRSFTIQSETTNCVEAYNDEDLDDVLFEYPALGMEAAEKELGKNASTLLKDEGRWSHKLESFGAWDKETSAFSWTEKAECGKAGVSDTVAPEMPQIRSTATCTAKLKIAAQHETLVLWPLLQLIGSVNQSSSVADRDRAVQMSQLKTYRF